MPSAFTGSSPLRTETGIEDHAAASLARVASLRAALVAEAVSLGALRDDADPDVRRHAVGIWRSLYRAGAVPEH